MRERHWFGASLRLDGAPGAAPVEPDAPGISRRTALGAAGALGLVAGAEALLPSYARAATLTGSDTALRPRIVGGTAVYDMIIGETEIEIAGRRTTAVTVNGTVPAPLLRMREDQDTILRVTNRLQESTSIHWHGLLVPPEMDGVPGISFHGIPPRTTFEYRFPLRQYGTYWYHSHSGLQEQLGHYGPIIIEPAHGPHPYRYDREYVVMLSDWTFENPYRVLAKLKKQAGYDNFQKLTVFDFFSDIAEKGFVPTVRDRLMWSRMRMDPTDISDLTGATYTYLMNGLAPASNWTGLFRPGERVLLHFINASAATFFDVRIPGLPMTLVQASGQYVQPVEIDEFRIAIAETYDVIVQPSEGLPYTIMAESMDRSGHARGTLAPREGMTAPLPPRRKRPILTMADMGMDHGGMAGGMKGMNNGSMKEMDHGSMPGATKPQVPAANKPPGAMQGHDMGAAGGQSHEGHDMKPAPGAEGGKKDSKMGGGDQAKFAVAGAIRREGLRPPGTLPGMLEHEADKHGPGNATVPMMVKSRLAEPGVGLGDDGWRVLVYTDLRALEKRPDFRAPTREIEMHLTGNMERFMWSIDGVPFQDSKPVAFTYGERLRLTMVNDSMMSHPMHLHGMWMELENGHGDMIPRVHTVSVKPAERISLLITADAPGRWAFHCHVLYHMEVGMFRVVEVSQAGHNQSGGHHDER